MAVYSYGSRQEQMRSQTKRLHVAKRLVRDVRHEHKLWSENLRSLKRSAPSSTVDVLLAAARAAYTTALPQAVSHELAFHHVFPAAEAMGVVPADFEFHNSTIERVETRADERYLPLLCQHHGMARPIAI